MNEWELLEIKLRADAEMAWANHVQARETGNYGPANAWDDCHRALVNMADRIREAHTGPPITIVGDLGSVTMTMDGKPTDADGMNEAMARVRDALTNPPMTFESPRQNEIIIEGGKTKTDE